MTASALVTIAYGRHEHLRRQLQWAAVLDPQPLVHVVVSMGDAGIGGLVRRVVGEHPPRPTVVVDMAPAAELPLAAARNLGVHTAAKYGAHHVMLIDVDCLPEKSLVADYQRALSALSGEHAVVSGRVRYLPEGVAESDYTPSRAAELGRDHNARVVPVADTLELAEHRMLWSLNLATTVSTWDHVGGFDERYVGYGGEDTDFGQRVAAAGGTHWWSGRAGVFHQYHATASPPVQHAAAIARNANIFRRTWGFDPMEGWLEQLQDMGHLTRHGQEWRHVPHRV